MASRTAEPDPRSASVAAIVDASMHTATSVATGVILLSRPVSHETDIYLGVESRFDE